VTPLVTTAVLLAAVTHACWNAIAHRITDKLVGFTLRGMRGRRPNWAAIGAALATGLSIAASSASGSGPTLVTTPVHQPG
jgi:succinate dehydrogenase/fumarate reductase cytochrome b subunit